jgi:hypothetical protein
MDVQHKHAHEPGVGGIGVGENLFGVSDGMVQAAFYYF